MGKRKAQARNKEARSKREIIRRYSAQANRNGSDHHGAHGTRARLKAASMHTNLNFLDTRAQAEIQAEKTRSTPSWPTQGISRAHYRLSLMLLMLFYSLAFVLLVAVRSLASTTSTSTCLNVPSFLLPCSSHSTLSISKISCSLSCLFLSLRKTHARSSLNFSGRSSSVRINDLFCRILVRILVIGRDIYRCGMWKGSIDMDWRYMDSSYHLSNDAVSKGAPPPPKKKGV